MPRRPPGWRACSCFLRISTCARRSSSTSGANEGDFSGAVLGLAPDARILAVEPGPATPRATAPPAGISNANVEIRRRGRRGAVGDRDVPPHGHDHNSSLLRPRPESQDAIGGGWEVV